MPPSPLRRWLPTAAVYAAILGLSSVPGEELAGAPAWAEVVGHATGYALLAWTIARAWAGPAAGAVAIGLAVVLGAVNEVQQGFVAGRSPDVADVGVDGLGALAAVYLRSSLSLRRPGSRPPGRGSAARR